MLQLARAIGYEVRPGVAATTWLAFTTTATPGAPGTVPLPVGTRVQSVPGAGELPQTFETVEAVDARPEWNEAPVAAAVPAAPAVGDLALRLLGDAVVLATGDPIVVVDGPGRWWSVRRVRRTHVVPAVQQTPNDPVPIVPATTVVTLDQPLAAHPLPTALAATVAGVEAHVLRQRAALFGFNAQPWDTLPVTLRIGELDPSFGFASPTALAAGLLAGGIKAQASTSRLLAGAYSTRSGSWADTPFPTGTTAVSLDQVYPKIVTGSLVVLERDDAVVLAGVAAVAEVPKADFGLAARTSRLALLGADAAGFSPRTTNVLAQSERLELAPTPIPGALAGTSVVALAHPVPDVPVGRAVVVSGLDAAGRPSAEVAVVHAAASTAAGTTSLTLSAPLTGSYQRPTARVLLNVARATHGESRAEVLGSGDARSRFQTFALRQAPLTYVPGATATGARTTLAVWVGGVRWHEVATLHGQPARARVYVTRRADDGTVSVSFGDGINGARLPSGQGNVVATYRVGIGRAALLGAGRLTLPGSRPLGLSAVTNPVPAEGADDPEPLSRARRNAPLTVRTLGRIVSRAGLRGLRPRLLGGRQGARRRPVGRRAPGRPPHRGRAGRRAAGERDGRARSSRRSTRPGTPPRRSS